jgi:hypothetical protein
VRLALGLLLAALPAGAEEVAVPSGQPVTFVEAILNEAGPEGLTARFRFIAPGIAEGGGVDFETAAADMEFLCQSYALPRIAATGPAPSQVVISLSASAVPFGEAAPDVTQFFEAYRIDGATCIWEAF